MTTTSFKVYCAELTESKKDWLALRINEYARIYSKASEFVPSLPTKYLKSQNPSELYTKWIKGNDGTQMLHSEILSGLQTLNALKDACANFNARKALDQKNTSKSKMSTPNIIKFENSEYQIIRISERTYGIHLGGKDGITIPLITNAPEKEAARKAKGTEWGLIDYLDQGIRMQEAKKNRNKDLARKRKENPDAKKEPRIKAGLGTITYNLRDNTISIPHTVDDGIPKGQKRFVNTIVGVDLGVNNTAVFTALRIFPDTQKQVQEQLEAGVKYPVMDKLHVNVLKVKVLKGFQTKDKMKQLRIVESKRRKLRKEVGSRRSDLKEFTNHRVSREIAKFAAQFPNSIVIFEKGLAKLKNPTWSPADVREKSEYKLKAMGVKTFDIHPAWTSQICHCGAIGTRTKGMVYFKCPVCGLGVGSNPASTIGQYNADVLASMNIALRGLRILTQNGETVGFEVGTVAAPNIYPDETAQEARPQAISEAVEGKKSCKDAIPVKVAETLPDETKADAQADVSRSGKPGQSTGNRITYGRNPPRGCASEKRFSSLYKGTNNSAGRSEFDEKTKISEVLSQSEF